MIELKNVSKYYYSKGIIAPGFTKVNVKFNLGEFVAITGESGSGKSTLLNVISGLDTYEEGEMFVNGKETSHYLSKDWENYRRTYIGNIYQNFNLINSYTVYQNVDLILSLNGIKKRKKRVIELLKSVDMLKYKNTKVSKLSGGQKQRVAIARALAKDVPIIIADEPTGNLDKASATSVIKLLSEIAKDKLIIIVTHNYEQVEEFVTRKITMHDGRILEDKKIRDINNTPTEIDHNNFKNISFFDELRLGIRNTFNVIPKFILMFLVYAFIVASLMGEYSLFKQGEYYASISGYNYTFRDIDDHRVIINKKDRTAFSEEEIENIKKLNNIKKVIENDILVDTYYNFTDEKEENWIDGTINDLEFLPKGKIIGEMPKEDNEILIEGPSDLYQLSNPDNLLGKAFYLYDDYTGSPNKNEKYIITGIQYNDDLLSVENPLTFSADIHIYVSKKVLNERLVATHENNSTISVDFIDHYYENVQNGYLQVVPNPWVYVGTAFIEEEEDYRCHNYNCLNNTITINVKNIYYQDSKSFVINKKYNKDNIGYIMTFPNYKKEDYDADYAGKIYINPIDYKALFNKGTYQMSVYVSDVQKLNNTVKTLDKLGYNSLKIRDTIIKTPLYEIIRIVKIFLTLAFVFVLFFITYFIIKIILKSRNIYFSIIRMLGASSGICLNLLMIELFVVSNLSYFIFLTLAMINKKGLINIGLLHTINTYFKSNDYILLYVILMVMSLLLSLRYARKLFKNSAMNTYREEI